MSAAITTELIKRALPKKLRGNFNDEMMGRLNGIVTDSAERDGYYRDIITYSSVLLEGAFRLEDYFSAVRYVGFKLTGNTNQLSYMKTFPHRYQRLVNMGKSDDEISNHVAAYHRTMLVGKILEQGVVPLYISHQDIAHEALASMVRTMQETMSDRIRIDAADRILLHLKIPEVAKVQLDLNIKEDDSIKELRSATLSLVKQQKEMLEAGVMNVKQVAHSKILIEGECVTEN